MGDGLIVSMDDRGRVLIPKDIRRKIKTKFFTVEFMDDGSIVLRPIANDVLKLAGKFKDLIKYRNIEELEEKQEEYIRKKRGI